MLAPAPRAQSLVHELDSGAAPVSLSFITDLTLIDDLDNDGIRDLACGSAVIHFVSAATGEALRTIFPTASSTYEFDLATLEDLDGDGYCEVVAGFPNHSTTGAYERGMVEVYSGRTGQRLFVVIGSAGDWRLGQAVASAGDVNGDGVGDFMAGAPGFAGPPPSGAANGGLVRIWSGADGSQLWSMDFGAVAGARWGSALTGLGDLDGDGKPSILVGAPGVGDAVVLEPGGNTPAVVITGTGNFGEAVASIGDQNGDGVRDVAVAQPDFQMQGPCPQGPFGPICLPPPPMLFFGRVRAHDAVTGALLYEQIGPNDGRLLGERIIEAGDVTGDGIGDVIAVDNQGDAVVFGVSGVITQYWSRLVVPAEDRSGDGLPDIWRAGSTWMERYASAAGNWMVSHDDTDLTASTRAVAVLGDLDGDGAREVAVGQPHATPGAGASDRSRGRVQIFSQGTLLHTITGLPGEELGGAVVGLPDVDGDGIDDFAVGRPNAIVGHSARNGRVTVYSGANATSLREHFGTEWGERFGAALARVPDTDGDGVDDYAIASPEKTGFGNAFAAGRVAIYSGATGNVLRTILGSFTFGRLGTSVAGSHDLNGDGHGDLLVAAPYAWTSITAFGAGQVHRYSGNTGVLLGTTTGTQAQMHLGLGLASTGADFDGDGVHDILMGAPRFNAPGGVDDGRVELRSGASGALIWSANGAFGSALGSSVAGAGDLDNDGVLDFVVGEPLAFRSLTDPTVDGRVRVYSGAGLAWYQTLQGEQDRDRFGTVVAAAADLDGDDFRDVVVGVRSDHDVLTGVTGVARVWTARALGSTAFGDGTPGCAGAHRLTAWRPAAPGQSLELRYSGMSPLTFPMLAIGATTFLGGVPVLGALAHVDPQSVDGLPLSSGTHGAVLVPLPSDPALVGAFVSLQVWGLWLAGCASLPFDLSSSNGLTVTVL